MMQKINKINNQYNQELKEINPFLIADDIIKIAKSENVTLACIMYNFDREINSIKFFQESEYDVVEQGVVVCQEHEAKAIIMLQSCTLMNKADSVEIAKKLGVALTKIHVSLCDYIIMQEKDFYSLRYNDLLC